MEALLAELQSEFQEVVESLWLGHPDDPQAAVVELLNSVYKILYRKGPIVRATLEAVPLDENLSAAWEAFVAGFDEIGAEVIRRDQAAGLAAQCDAVMLAQALNRMNVAFAVKHFGQRPRTQLNRVVPTAIHIWTNSIYGGN